MLVRYLASLNRGRLILWCYFIWYTVVLVRYFEAFPIFRSPDFVLRPMVTAWAFLWPASVVLAATLLAGVYPAWRAARVDPVGALRGIG